MADNDGNQETKRDEQQELVEQQQVLFRELSREQTEAEQDLEEEQEESAKPQDESGA